MQAQLDQWVDYNTSVAAAPEYSIFGGITPDYAIYKQPDLANAFKDGDPTAAQMKDAMLPEQVYAGSIPEEQFYGGTDHISGQGPGLNNTQKISWISLAPQEIKAIQTDLMQAGYLDPDIFSFFHENNINLLSGYGMTEATGGITMTPPNDYRPDSVGIALPGIKLKIEHDGELCIKGPYVADGYYKEKNNLFSNGWFHTEDIFKQNDSHYYIIDRKKDIYKNSRGQTISPQKIENLFQDFDTVKSVFLVGDGKEFNTVLLYPNYDALSNYNTSSDPDKLREVFSSMILSVNSFLAPYERIINYVIINRDFTTGNGEVTQKGSFVRKIILENFKRFRKKIIVDR